MSGKKRLKREECAAVPQKPGVYRLYDKNGKHIYTGRSSRLRHRISAWYQKDKSRPAWKKRLAQQAKYFTFTVLNGKRESMKKEKTAIKKHKPRFNHYSKH